VVGRGRIRPRGDPRHELSTPGHPRILDEHYPEYPPGNGPRIRPFGRKDDAEAAFLSLGDGAERWLREACGTGVQRVRSKMRKGRRAGRPVRGGAGRPGARHGALAGRFEDG